MKQSTYAVTFLAAAVSAFPQYGSDLTKRQDDHTWQAPAGGAARAPCPGLNTLANHGYINRDGRGISTQAMQQGFLDAFGFAFDATNAGAGSSLGLCQSHFNNGNACDTFDLDMLNVPHQIEHDASMTRNDAEMSWNMNADNHDFNGTVWQQTQCAYGGADHITPSLSNTARLLRIAEAQAEDAPGWFSENDGGSGAEHGFMLNVMNDFSVAPLGSGNYPSARLDWINHWFSNEELPTALGWTKPAQQISNDMVNSVAGQVFGAATVANNCGTSPTTTSSSSSTSPTSTSSTSSTMSGYKNATTTGTTISTPSGGYNYPTPSASVSSIASSSASQVAPPAPTFPNAYEQSVSAGTWSVVYEQCANRVASYQDTFYKIVGGGSPSNGKPSGGAGAPASGGSGSSGSGAGSAPGPVVVWQTVTVTVPGNSCPAPTKY